MTARFDQVLAADAVVVGSGIAGLTAALELAPLRVIVLSKTEMADGSTPYAQGGIAAAMGEDDSPALARDRHPRCRRRPQRRDSRRRAHR